ncbi:unnamed protein product [Strongylus vulgaris]|uniref:FAD-dependent oxidoreductase 2 FAD-binding domain-containing protein n=1 Tax=Strongylus vulgaris TaxID=40348 RepID=A0A3P7JP44_STRVU|nr:unnamed protein product [Strongylus vulgaris]
MARAMGAKVIGMDRVQIHPTAFVDPADPGAGTKFLAAEALRGKGAILITPEGVRFANELGRRDYLTGRILQDSKPIVKFHVGSFSRIPNGSAGMTSAIMLMNDEADAFGKTVFPVAFELEKPIYAAIITPAIHYTMGGLKIDKQARVINEYTTAPFKGLLAAGEVTGALDMLYSIY